MISKTPNEKDSQQNVNIVSNVNNVSNDNTDCNVIECEAKLGRLAQKVSNDK